MPMTTAPIEASIEIAAPPAQVWSLLSDLTKMPRWSPQVRKTIVRGGTTKQGAKMFNINRRGLLVWPTQSMVTVFEPEQQLAFRIKENATVWSFTLAPNASGGTTLVEKREAPHGVSDLSIRVTKAVLGGVEKFTAEMQQGMEQTLKRIKAEVER